MSSFLRARRRHSAIGSSTNVVPVARTETTVIALKSSSLTEESDQKLKKLRRFGNGEFRIGRRCGRGSFCDVFDIESSSDAESSHSADIDSNSPVHWNEMKEHIPRGEVVLKRLSQEIRPSQVVGAAMDLALEACVLSSLSHKNIIKIHGITKEGEKEGARYSLVLERLHDILDDRIREWKEEESRFKVQLRVSETSAIKRRKQLLTRGMVVAFDISSALRYLHDRDIVFRDLKPSNVGFDAQGRAKLFDFGLAREIPKDEGQRTDVYKMSGNTGTLRYMAPEVARYEPYNTSADVYSFGMLLWQMFSLEKPFGNFKVSDFMKHVVQGGRRPKLDRSWPTPLRDLIQKCWAPDLSERPPTSVVRTIIAQEIVAIESQSEQPLDSTLSRVSSMMPDAVFRRRLSY